MKKFEEHKQIHEEIYGSADETEGTYMILQTALRVLEGKKPLQRDFDDAI